MTFLIRKIDFDAIKQEIAIEDVAELLDIKVRGKRFQCPNQTAKHMASGTKGYAGSLIQHTNAWYCFCGACFKRCNSSFLFFNFFK